MQDSTVQATIKHDEAGMIIAVEMKSEASTRDRLVLAMYLMEDAIREAHTERTSEDKNPISQFVTDSFNSMVGLQAIMNKMKEKVEKEAAEASAPAEEPKND